MTARVLSYAQEARLDRRDLEHAQVVGWRSYGPVVRLPDGGLRRVKPDGRLTVVHAPKEQS